MAVPQKHTESYYEFNEVMHYLEKKHRKSFRNYAGTKFTGKPDDAPYQDFWHYMLDFSVVHNGGPVNMPELDYDFHPEWVREILGYFKEFLGDEYDEPMRVFW
jgi:hypothetical protein